MEVLCGQFLKETKYLLNVSLCPVAAYRWDWKAFEQVLKGKPTAARELDEEQHEAPLQTSFGPHLHREEVRRYDQLPVAAEELFPRCFALSFGSRLKDVALQDAGDRTAGDLVAQI
jgi:hypothetical protein